MFERHEHFVGGKWLTAAGRDIIEVVSPSTEQIVGRVPAARAREVDGAVAAARSAFEDGPLPRLSVAERAGHLRVLVAGTREAPRSPGAGTSSRRSSSTSATRYRSRRRRSSDRSCR
jgi:hypothetical protein